MTLIGLILPGSVVIILYFIFNIHTQQVDCSQLVLPIAFEIYQSAFDTFLRPKRVFKLNNALW